MAPSIHFPSAPAQGAPSIAAALTRRSMLGALIGAAVAGRAAPALARPVADLEILGAPTGATISLSRAIASGALAQAAPNARFRLWRDPDELRAGIVSGRVRLFSTPTHVPANLANRGLPIRLLCLLGQGHLYIVTSDPRIESFKDLAGQPILGFFRNDMPDLVFRACARMEGMNPDTDFRLSYVQGGMEAAQMLAAGKATTAILSEPAATAALTMGAHAGLSLRRAISLQKVWQAHKGGLGIPMVGVAIHEQLVQDDPELIAALATALPQALDWALENPAEAGQLAEATMQMKAPIFAKALPSFNMEIVSARVAQPQLAAFYQTILDMAPDALAGKLPDDAFYLSF